MRANRVDNAARRRDRRALRIQQDGRWVAPLPPQFHGRVVTYQEWACRCIPCTEANTAAHRAYIQRRRERLAQKGKQ